MTAIIDGTNGVTTPNVLTSSSGVALTLQSGGTTAVTIDTSQNVGVGTTSPSYKLDVQGATDTVIRSKGTSGTAGGIFKADGFGSGSYPGLQLAQSGTSYWTIGQRGDTNLHLYRESGSGNVSVDGGNLTFGSSNAGIVFNNSSATTNSTLNDYEAGTFTPTQQSGLTGSGITLAGRYVKIGQNVTIQIQVNGTSLATTGGALLLSNLPFTITSTSGPLAVGAFADNSNSNWRGIFVSGTSIYSVGSATSGTNALYFSVSYIANF
jgi:hypothetical protein